ncbi:MAG TPA: hypothetical protein VKA19_02735, partial [Alphaproteobacteria bacterium]|nr:hypothetical protein [Alphaproteobacteria bacterium]
LGKMEKAGRPGVAKGLSLETWDAIKSGLDKVLSSRAYTNELTGRLNKQGYAPDQLRRALLKELDKATGGEKSLYAAARRQYGGDAEVLQALREGKGFMKEAPEQIRKKMADMSDAAKEAYRSGAARAVKDVVDSTPDTASAANRLFNKSITRNRIRAVFPSNKAYNEFARKMRAEQQFAKTKNAITSGSRTAPVQAEQQDAQRALGNMGAVLGSKIPFMHPLVMSGIGRRVARGLGQTNEATDRALSRMLFNRDQTMNQNVIAKLLEQQAAKPLTEPTTPLARALAAALAQQEGRFIGQNQ